MSSSRRRSHCWQRGARLKGDSQRRGRGNVRLERLGYGHKWGPDRVQQ